MKDADDFIERRIAIGSVVSTDYLRQLVPIYKSEYIDASPVNIIVGWCIDYFEKYDKAPGRDIEGIFTAHIKDIDERKAERIERILQSLSDEYERDKFNSDYLYDETEKYFRSQNIRQFTEDVAGALERGDVLEAENIASGYSFVGKVSSQSVDPLVEDNGELARKVFEQSSETLIKFPGALGQFWNDEMSRESFVGLMGPEKRGKSWILLEFVFRAARSGNNVAFFQAGDMSESQQLRRVYSYLSRKSYKKKYCGEMLVPVPDCLLNQRDECSRDERTCSFGVEEDILSKSFSSKKLRSIFDEYQDYKPCKGCPDYVGSFWYSLRPKVNPLTAGQAYRKGQKLLRSYGHRIRISTWSNGTLSVEGVTQQIGVWEKQEEFVPDVIVIDYADLLVPRNRSEFRHQQNQIWADLRGLSESRHCLVVTATQADAQSYGKDILSMKNFSEDKRKYAHVTAMYGLNQTEDEKIKGIMRINQIVVREDDFSMGNQVVVLQRLQVGRPYLGSFFRKYEKSKQEKGK